MYNTGFLFSSTMSLCCPYKILFHFVFHDIGLKWFKLKFFFGTFYVNKKIKESKLLWKLEGDAQTKSWFNTLYDSLFLIMTLVAVTWTEGDKADVMNVRRMLCSRGISGWPPPWWLFLQKVNVSHTSECDMWKKAGQSVFLSLCPHENNSVIYPLRPVITTVSVTFIQSMQVQNL